MVRNERFWELQPHMTPAARAKQFIPFSPLRGYAALLREKERGVEAKAGGKPDNPEHLE